MMRSASAVRLAALLLALAACAGPPAGTEAQPQAQAPAGFTRQPMQPVDDACASGAAGWSCTSSGTAAMLTYCERGRIRNRQACPAGCTPDGKACAEPAPPKS